MPVKTMLVALAAFVFDSFRTGRGNFDYQDFWIRNLASANAAKVIARHKGMPHHEDYFVYGLLHDIGIVIMMQHMPTELANIRTMMSEGVPQYQAEEEVLGCTHNELGGSIAALWNFPLPLSAVILHHDMINFPDEFQNEIAIITCANTIALALDVGDTKGHKIAPIDPKVWQAAGIAPEDMEKILDNVLVEMENARPFIEMLNR